MEISIGKTGAIVNVDFASLPQTSQDFVLAYGLRQVLNDAHASRTQKAYGELKNPALTFAQWVQEAVDEKLAVLQSGEVSSRSAREPSDPRAKIIIGLAKAELLAALKARKVDGKPSPLSFKQIGEEQVAIHVAKLVEKNIDRYGAEADRQLAAKAEAVADIDLADLGI